MDIIMPVFDGVSATACIRMVAPRTPIIAMTSNIRQEDINIYFHWGKCCVGVAGPRLTWLTRSSCSLNISEQSR